MIWVKETMPGWMIIGTAPAMPARKLPTPEPARERCTWRKSTARASRQDTRCKAMASPLACMEMIRPRKRKDGSKAQKETPKSGAAASPGQLWGTPSQGAFSTGAKSKMPIAAATMQPATMPMTGAHRRRAAEKRSVRPATMTSVARAVSGAATGWAAAASSSRPKTTEASVTESIIITVPPTVGVTMRRRMNSQRETMICTTAETTIRAVRVAGPPSATAVMQKGMVKAAVNIGMAAPAPAGPSRRTCRMVARPTDSSEAKTIQMR